MTKKDEEKSSGSSKPGPSIKLGSIRLSLNSGSSSSANNNTNNKNKNKNNKNKNNNSSSSNKTEKSNHESGGGSKPSSSSGTPSVPKIRLSSSSSSSLGATTPAAKPNTNTSTSNSTSNSTNNSSSSAANTTSSKINTPLSASLASLSSTTPSVLPSPSLKISTPSLKLSTSHLKKLPTPSATIPSATSSFTANPRLSISNHQNNTATTTTTTTTTSSSATRTPPKTQSQSQSQSQQGSSSSTSKINLNLSSSSSSKPTTQRPTVRLNLTPPSGGSQSSGTPFASSSSATKSQSQSQSHSQSQSQLDDDTPSAKKKIKFSTSKINSSSDKGNNINLSKSTSFQTRLWHQRTSLSFKYYKKNITTAAPVPVPAATNTNTNIGAQPLLQQEHVWGYQGTTTLYITQEDHDANKKRSKSPTATTSSNDANTNMTSSSTPNSSWLEEQTRMELGLHLRGGCIVDDIQAFTMEVSKKKNKEKQADINTDRNTNDKKAPPPSSSSSSSHEEEGELKEESISSSKGTDDDDTSKSTTNTPTKTSIDPNKTQTTATVQAPAPTTTTSRSVSPDPATQPQSLCTPEEYHEVKLHPLNVSYKHLDPLAKVFYTPSKWMKRDLDSFSEDPTTTTATTTTKPIHKYEGDAYCNNGGKRMMRALRVASASSALGELRLVLSHPSNPSNNKNNNTNNNINNNVNNTTNDTHHSNSTTATPILFISEIDKKNHHHESNEIDLAQEGWKRDLLEPGEDEVYEEGHIYNTLHQKAFLDDNRSYRRKMKRIQYISQQLALHSVHSSSSSGSTPTTSSTSTSTSNTSMAVDSSSNEKDKQSSSTTNNSKKTDASVPSKAIKIVIRFHIPDTSLLQFKSSSGLHFMTPSYTHLSSGACAPYVYTSCGTLGDHQGPRCWVPCLDSSNYKHRSSHELCIKVTANKQEGMSIVGCGEDFGQTDTVIRSCHSRDASHLVGNRHYEFLKDVREYQQQTDPYSLLATCILYTSIFTPIPARSLGFAIGPFLACPDPEYPNDIRQIYLAPIPLRSQLHSSQPVRTPTSLHNAVLAGTSGVPLRALSLTREILGLPAFRSSTYTQVWLPSCVDGGSSSGTFHHTATVACNAWMGGATLDSHLLPPLNHRLPFHAGGRVLQMAQARNAILGWVLSSLPLGGEDDVGQGYIHHLMTSQLMEIYERAHGGSGEGGGKASHFHVERFVITSGLNGCGFLDFLPVQNVEEDEMMGGLGSVGLAVEEKKKEELWRGVLNGTESRTSAMDEISLRQVLTSDILEYWERHEDSVPLPSPDWQGSHLSLTFLSSNSCSSSCVGSGATDLLHPLGGSTFRTLKCNVLSQAIAGRAGLPNFIRFMRACFIATMLMDAGETEFVLPEWNPPSSSNTSSSNRKDKSDKSDKKEKSSSDKKEEEKKEKEEEIRPRHRPPFVLCVDDIIKKGGVTNSLVTSSLRRLAGPIREPYLHGHSHWSLIDISTDIKDAKNRPLVEPEGFPNSYIRGFSTLYLRVGVHVEMAGGDGVQAGAQSSATLVKGIHLHVYAEPIIPRGGISFTGPITLRVVENEGQCCEYERKLTGDGRREEWGPVFLHARTVTTAKQQNAASGGLDGAGGKDGGKRKGCYNRELLHGGGYQTLELIRLTNRTPLLWIRVDPHYQYPGARIHISQPDTCLAEQLFHDGDAGGQISALRTLSERPTRIQGSVKITNIYDVKVHEMPVRILGDCLRGSVALHCSLPHTPAIRAQAALAIAQWQNNKAPASKDAVGVDAWLGLEILLQYFKERHLNRGHVMPVKYTRRSIKMPEAETNKTGSGGGSGSGSANVTDHYQYLDMYDENDRAEILDEAEDVVEEEDEEYRVRSAVITAIASIRAKDGQTPPSVLRFLESILVSGDGAALENIASLKEGMALPPHKRLRRSETSMTHNDTDEKQESDDEEDYFLSEQQILDVPYVSTHVIADALLALCHVNCRPAVILDSSGNAVQVNTAHPILNLMEACHRWLDWELYKESIRLESEQHTMSSIGGNCYSITAAAGITALSQLAILRNCTTNSSASTISDNNNSTNVEEATESKDNDNSDDINKNNKRKESSSKTKHSDQASSSLFYANIFDETPKRSDTIRAAAAQAVVCVCCAADRLKARKSETFGLLTALEFLLDRIIDPSVSPGLRQTLAAIMMDVCSGNICSMPRIAVIGGRNDLISSVSRLVCGPLGGCAGGDNGSALLMTVSENNYPAAHAVNHGALEGLRMLKHAGKDDQAYSEKAVIRVAQFATKLWRTMNGEMGIGSVVDNDVMTTTTTKNKGLLYVDPTGICAFDGHLRIALLSFWQKIWPRECYSIHLVQMWREKRGLVVPNVIEPNRAKLEDIRNDERELEDLSRVVQSELGRQNWRGEMATKAYNYWAKDGKRGMKDLSGSASQGLGHPLPVVEKDKAWKMGGWSASSAQQRRKMALDGGTAVNRIRAKMKSSSGGD